jgi:hypothetical protein
MQRNGSWIRHAAGYQNRVRSCLNVRETFGELEKSMIQENKDRPLITVVGAASKQGRSVVHALLDSGRYRVRALTRRRDSQPAQVLAQRGAEVLIAPLQPGVQAELTAAMRGSAGAFLMTPPIVKVPPADDEFTLGRELADAALAAGVEHVVFSGLEHVEARTGGTKWAPHFTDKARVEAYIRSLPIRSSLCTWRFSTPTSLNTMCHNAGPTGSRLPSTCRRTSPCRSLIRSPPRVRRYARCSITRRNTPAEACR